MFRPVYCLRGLLAGLLISGCTTVQAPAPAPEPGPTAEGDQTITVTRKNLLEALRNVFELGYKRGYKDGVESL